MTHDLDAASGQDQGLVLTWVDTLEAQKPFQADWQDLAERTGADPYLMPEWQMAWWRHFGPGRQPVCLLAHARGRLVGVLPFCVETLWAGPLPLRIARLAGSDPHCMIFRLPLDAAFAGQVMRAALLRLTGPAGCAAVSFTPVSDLAAYLEGLRGAAGRGSGLALREEAAGAHVVFDLPPRFDEFLDRISKKRRGQFRRDVKGLEETFGMQGDRVRADARALGNFVTFHNRQWQALGRGGHFVDWPGSAGFYADLAESGGAGGGVQLHRLTAADGSPLAAQFALVAGQTAHWRLPARSLDPAAERLSAGKAGLLDMIERLIADGVTRIEAGRGDYGYKLDYGGRSVPVHRLILYPDRPGAARRLRLLLAATDLLDLLYYRIWFLKLVPRLQRLTGRAPRALWRCWIRSRI